MKRRSVLERLRKFWGDLSISKKMIVVMLSTVLLVSFFLTFVYYFMTADINRKYTERILVSSLNHAAVNLDMKMDAVERVLYDVSTNRELQEEMTRMSREQDADAYTLREYTWKITQIMVSESIKESSITGILVYDNDGNLFHVINLAYDYDEAKKHFDFARLEEGEGKTVWFDFIEIKGRNILGDDYVILPAGKVIYNSITQKKIGYVVVYADVEYFMDSIRSLQLYEDDVIFLQDAQGNLVGADEEILSKVEDWPLQMNQISSCFYDGDKKYVATWQGENGILKTTLITRNANESTLLKSMQKVTVFMLLMTGICSLLIIRRISYSISHPILTLAEEMKKTSHGNFSRQVSAKYNDEVGILKRSFNDLLTEIRVLINDVYKVRLQEQEAQLRMLQMQINPHFLYNTLDTINWLAQAHGAKDVTEVSQSLGYLMRFSLAEKELISLEEELDAVEHYMLIQSYRYGEGLKIEMQIEEEALYETVPRHIILPLVENAIDHGLKNKAGEKRVRVCGWIQGDALCIEVSDNGIGMSPERLEEVLEKCFDKQEKSIKENGSPSSGQQSSHMSIGLQNVNRRICLRYGEAYGLQINSEKGKGTSIILHVPYSAETNWEKELEVENMV